MTLCCGLRRGARSSLAELVGANEDWIVSCQEPGVAVPRLVVAPPVVGVNDEYILCTT